jgi:hypothetical protein
MWRLLVPFLLLTAVTAHAQITAQSQHYVLCTLRVDVAFAGGGRATSGLRVELLQGLITASPSEVEMTNSSGSAEFPNLMPGAYRVQVSGDGIETTTSGIIQIEDGRPFESQYVTVRRTVEANAGAGNGASGSTVTVGDLNVPQKASEELARGDAEMLHNNWKKAAEHFNKSVSIYPQYCSAYYNLSVAYYRLGQSDAQRDALQKALTINDHFVPALVSLAHLEVTGHKLPDAMTLLDKALSTDAANLEALALRVRVDFMQGQYEQTIADARKVHSIPHQGYATVHYSAAAAFERLNRIPEMIAELQTFLQEDPTSPNAESVRHTIADLESQHH